MKSTPSNQRNWNRGRVILPPIDYLLIRSHHTGWFLLGCMISFPIILELPLALILIPFLVFILLTLRADYLVHHFVRQHPYGTHKQGYETEGDPFPHPKPIVKELHGRWVEKEPPHDTPEP